MEHNSFNSPEIYFRCNACARVICGADAATPGSDILTPCCSARSKGYAPWPDPAMRKMLETIRELRSDGQRDAAVVMLSRVLELMMEGVLRELLEHARVPENERSRLLIEHQRLEAQVKLHDTVSTIPFGVLLASLGLHQFLADWRDLSGFCEQLRQQSSNQGELGEETDVRTFNACLKVFALIFNNLKLQPVHLARSGGAQRSLLIVDDEAESRNHLARIIERSGIRALVAGTGQEALEIFGRQHPECVLLDVILPDIDGLSVFRQMKELDDKARIYFLTGMGGAVFQQKAEKLGASGYLQKPVDLDTLMRIVQEPGK